MQGGIRLRQDPVFVVGYPRSGTTLLQALLATQGELVAFPETHFFCTVFAENPTFRQTIDYESAKGVLESISQKSGITFEDDFISAIQNSSDIVSIKDFFEALVLKLFPECVDLSKRWLEKTPDHGLYMEQIARYYPEAKFVGIVRNPFFAINSRTKYFPPKTRNLLKFLAIQWAGHLNAFEKFVASNPDKAFMVKYEELTANHEDLISKICQFLGIEFEPERLKNYGEKAKAIIQPFEHWKKDVKTSHIYIRNESPKSVFPVRKILKIQSIVLEKMKKYGYEPIYPGVQRVYNFFRII